MPCGWGPLTMPTEPGTRDYGRFDELAEEFAGTTNSDCDFLTPDL